MADYVHTGLILGLSPANERCHYKVTPSLIGWAAVGANLESALWCLGQVCSDGHVWNQLWIIYCQVWWQLEESIAAVTMQTENCHDANLVISGGATGCPEVSPVETKLAPWWFAVFNVTSWSVFICANALTWDKWDMHVLYGNVDVDIHTSNHVYCISHVCSWFIVCRTDDLYHRIRETIKYSVFCTFRAFTLASYYTCNDIGNSWAC